MFTYRKELSLVGNIQIGKFTTTFDEDRRTKEEEESKETKFYPEEEVNERR